MILDDLNKLQGVLDDIERLQKRSKLLNEILHYYNAESMTFEVPAKWKGQVKTGKMPAESPRHLLKDKLIKYLSDEEYIPFY